MLKDKIYDRKIVKKPWGYEYVALRNKNKLAITFLNINHKKKTSLHCHPSKKTGFILLKGTAKIQLGLWKKNSYIYKSPSKLMIRTGLFHSIEAISKNGINALEFETPVKKNDLVRYEDSYGRKLKPYEGKNFIKPLKKTNFFFRKATSAIDQKYKLGKVKIKLKVYKTFDNIINQKDKTIFAVIDGNIIDDHNRKLLSVGDIIKTGTFKKLSKYFKINKSITLLSVYS